MGIRMSSPMRSGAAARIALRSRQHAPLGYYASVYACASACHARASCRLLRSESNHLPGLVDSQTEPRRGLRTSGRHRQPRVGRARRKYDDPIVTRRQCPEPEGCVAGPHVMLAERDRANPPDPAGALGIRVDLRKKGAPWMIVGDLASDFGAEREFCTVSGRFAGCWLLAAPRQVGVFRRTPPSRAALDAKQRSWPAQSRNGPIGPSAASRAAARP